MTKQEANHRLAEWCGMTLDSDGWWHRPECRNKANFDLCGCSSGDSNFFTSAEASEMLDDKIYELTGYTVLLRMRDAKDGQSIRYGVEGYRAIDGHSILTVRALMALRLITGETVTVEGVE